LFAPTLLIICWVFVGVAWSASAGYWAWTDRRKTTAPEKASGEAFEGALEDYLKGNWFEAERKLNVLIRRDEHDLEARLLMATLLRHTKRFDEATHQLNLPVRLDGAHRWALEIHREGELLMEARKHTITSVNSEHQSKGDN
jgi:predicted Zn-dependent protease